MGIQNFIIPPVREPIRSAEFTRNLLVVMFLILVGVGIFASDEFGAQTTEKVQIVPFEQSIGSCEPLGRTTFALGGDQVGATIVPGPQAAFVIPNLASVGSPVSADVFSVPPGFSQPLVELAFTDGALAVYDVVVAEGNYSWVLRANPPVTPTWISVDYQDGSSNNVMFRFQCNFANTTLVLPQDCNGIPINSPVHPFTEAYMRRFVAAGSTVLQTALRQSNGPFLCRQEIKRKPIDVFALTFSVLSAVLTPIRFVATYVQTKFNLKRSGKDEEVKLTEVEAE